jgi:hypothetical protein
MIERKKLPIGVQTFRKIREGDFYYVDKTGFAMTKNNGLPCMTIKN